MFGFLKLMEEIFELKLLLVSGAASALSALDPSREPVGNGFHCIFFAVLLLKISIIKWCLLFPTYRDFSS